MKIFNPEITGSAVEISTIVQGGIYDTSVETANFTATANTVHILSSSAAITASLPSSPEVGDSVKFSNLTAQTSLVARNGNNIMDLAEDMTIDVTTGHFEMVYGGSTTGWVIIA